MTIKPLIEVVAKCVSATGNAGLAATAAVAKVLITAHKAGLVATFGRITESRLRQDEAMARALEADAAKKEAEAIKSTLEALNTVNALRPTDYSDQHRNLAEAIEKKLISLLETPTESACESDLLKANSQSQAVLPEARDEEIKIATAQVIAALTRMQQNGPKICIDLQELNEIASLYEKLTIHNSAKKLDVKRTPGVWPRL